MEIARGLDSLSAAAFGEQLAAGVSQFRQGVEPGDDQTLIVLRATGSPTPPRKVRVVGARPDPGLHPTPQIR